MSYKIAMPTAKNQAKLSSAKAAARRSAGLDPEQEQIAVEIFSKSNPGPRQRSPPEYNVIKSSNSSTALRSAIAGFRFLVCIAT